MKIIKSRTMLPVLSNLIFNCIILPVSDSSVILGLNLGSKLTFGYHIRSEVSSAAITMENVRCASKIFGSSEVLTT